MGVSSSPNHQRKSKQSKEVTDLKSTKRRELSKSSKSELVARKRKRVRDSLGALRIPRESQGDRDGATSIKSLFLVEFPFLYTLSLFILLKHVASSYEWLNSLVLGF